MFTSCLIALHFGWIPVYLSSVGYTTLLVQLLGFQTTCLSLGYQPESKSAPKFEIRLPLVRTARGLPSGPGVLGSNFLGPGQLFHTLATSLS